MRLPNGESSVVDPPKLSGYVLSTTHLRGRNKARVFASSLGLTALDALLLARELQRVAVECECVLGAVDRYGQRYVIDFQLTVRDRSAWIRSSWLVAEPGGTPRFLTCYVL